MEMASDRHHSVIRPLCKRFVRGMSSNLLQSVFKLILKGFAKEILSDQLQPVSLFVKDFQRKLLWSSCRFFSN